MDFWEPFFKEIYHLTRESAFVRSGVLWGPYPEGSLMVALLTFVFFLVILGRQHAGWIPTLKQVGLSLLFATLALFAGLLGTAVYETFAWAPYTLLQNAVAKAKQDQAREDQQRLVKPPEPRKFGYGEITFFLAGIAQLPRPCRFRIIAAPENLDLRAQLKGLVQFPVCTRVCEIIDDEKDGNPLRFEEKPDYPIGSVIVRTKPSWGGDPSSNMEWRFGQTEFHHVVHGKSLPEHGDHEIEIVLGTGSLW
jgi:hypothetical protein